MSDSLPEAVPTEAPAREPWRAVNLSMMLPGLGQLEAGERAAGWFFLVGSLVLWLLAVAFFFLPPLPGWVGVVLIFMTLAFDIAAIFDAYAKAKSANTPEQEETRTSQRDAWKTTFFNRLLPGIGHAYEGRWWGAVLWLVGFLLAASLPATVGALASAAVMGGAVWHGWARTRARAVPDRSLVLAVVLASGACTAASLAIPDWLRANFFQAFKIPSDSMAPTLQHGDHVLINRQSFVPRDGDLVVYAPPRSSNLFIKRVFAVPGEVVEFRSDGGYRDGQLVLPGPVGSQPVVFGDEGHPYRVREGEVFLMGDYLRTGYDSRIHGPIPIERLRGRVYKTYWPPGRALSFR